MYDVESAAKILRQAKRAKTLTRLQEWEFYKLNDDGKAEGVQERMTKNEDVFNAGFGGGYGEAMRKYGYLAPEGYWKVIRKPMWVEHQVTGEMIWGLDNPESQTGVERVLSQAEIEAGISLKEEPDRSIPTPLETAAMSDNTPREAALLAPESSRGFNLEDRRGIL